MSTVNLLFTIGAQFSIILFDKKMYKSVISSSLYKNKNEIISKHNNSMNNLQGIKEKEPTNNITNIEQKLSDKSNNEFNPNKKNKKINNFDKKILKQLNYCDIIKSFICLKNHKSQLINFCTKTIIEYFSIENMFERFNRFEMMYSFLSKKNETEMKKIHNDLLKDINKYIIEIKKEMKIETEDKPELEVNRKNIQIGEKIKHLN